ncbi:hypothetical protein AcW1_009912 [Taiwanofungus camphoratus]|nr:hypothetical protein AcV7_005264 [Antrodia cinnamomea]KAI0946451.1 hypothetical protein AcW1_009912 [Antrodia cinnamomea]
MLALHPNSTCDVCLEGYNSVNVPHAISCGHIFCLRCLQSLSRQCCPLCRTPFVLSDARKLHIDKGSRPPTPPSSLQTYSSEAHCHARHLHDCITRIVREGAPSTEVRDVIEDVREWLLTQPPDEHADLRSAYLLLFRYTDLQYKAVEEKHTLPELQRTCQDLKEQLRSEREDATARYEDLCRMRIDEQETAKAVEKSLREHHSKAEKDWNLRLEVCVAECRRLNNELKELKRNRYNIPPVPRSAESRQIYAAERVSLTADSMAIVKDDSLDSLNGLKMQTTGKEDMFHLSPIPPTLPIPALPSSTFRPLTDDMDDRDDDDDNKSQKSGTNPYLLRTIQPIPIKSNLHRMPSNSSLLSRYDADVSWRSVPRGSLDVHMASCSSSPNISIISPSTCGHGDVLSSSVRSSHEGALGLRMDDFRRTSAGSHSDSCDPEVEEQRQRLRVQLRDLLDDPSLKTRRHFDSGSEILKEPSAPQSTPAPRNPSPVSPSTAASVSASASAVLAPPLPGCTQHQPLQRSNTISRASTAALAAERARASAMHPATSATSQTSAPRAAATKDYELMLPPPPPPPSQPHSQTRPQYSRRQSIDSLKSKSATATASGLTRSLWAMQEAQRV